MKYNVSLVIDVPCFKCLFWDEKKESHLNCKPSVCEALTEWALKEAEKYHNETFLYVEPPVKSVRNAV